ncbi:MAG: membrane dipeptidase [Luteolibacter sp.]
MNTSQHLWSRRNFVFAATGIGAGAMMTPGWSLAAEEVDSRVAAIVSRTMGIDTHNHIDVPLKAEELPGPALDLAGEMKRSGLAAICMTFAVDYQKLVNPGDAFERFQRGLDAMDKLLAANELKRSMNLSEVKLARKELKPTVIQSVEGGHFLEGKLDRLEMAYERGLRHLGLLHDNDASTPLGDVYTNAPKWGGLSAFGAEVIKECNRLGVLVDLAHASNETINAALKIAAHPVLISHTGLDTQLGRNDMMAKMMRPRLISKEQAKIVADGGGVIGVWTHLAETPLEYANNIRALVDVIGIDHVGIGTDTKMTPAYQSPSDTRKPGGSPDHEGGSPDRNKGSAGGPGNGSKGSRVGERTNEAWAGQNAGFYYAVVDAMLKTGFNEEEIGKIGGGNFWRVFDAATKGH